MESRRQKVGEDRLNSPSGSASEYSEPLPVEIIVEIFSRLPVKSVAICRCVSKSWASMLRRPDFTELLFTRSCARPGFLFVCRNYEDRKLLLFSAPQPQNLDEDLNPSPVAATCHMKVACKEICDLFSPIGGLFGFSDYQLWGEKDSATKVCNPSTGQIFTLPKMSHLRSCVGYDPIGKEFKVLSIQVSQEYHVLTLGNGQPSWRMVQCGLSHYPGRDVICINGVLYYEAAIDRSSRTSMIARFDLRTETYSFIQLTEAVTSVLNDSTTLVNYNGSLALFDMETSDYMSSSVVMCVLEDNETHRWSTHTYVLPFGLDYVAAEGGVSFVANEIVFSSYSHSPPDLFYVTFYSFERHTIGRVAIQGMGATKGHRVHTFLNHVENVKLMQVL